MNKQEKVFNWIDNNTGQGISDGKLYFNMFFCEPNAIKNKIKDLLNDSQKVKVPPCVDEYLNFCMKTEMSLTKSLKRETSSGIYASYPDDFKFIDEALEWLESPINQDIFADAWLHGWEVEEEPKWVVCYSTMYLKEPLNDTANSNFVISIDLDEDGGCIEVEYDDSYESDWTAPSINYCPMCGRKLEEGDYDTEV